MARNYQQHPVTRTIRHRILSGIDRAVRESAICQRNAAHAEVLRSAEDCLDHVAIHLTNGETICAPPIRTSGNDCERDPIPRVVRLGVFPVNGNPLHWGHLLFCLRAMANHKLDLVVVVIQGIDHRKQRMSAMTEPFRHEMAREVIRVFHPLLVYSNIGKGTEFVGEENVFRLLRLNPRQAITAHYLVGADHYRSVDALGLPDTLPRLERNIEDPTFSFDPTVHSIRALFAERGARVRHVASALEVSFIPTVIESSSTAIRNGQSDAAPYEVLRYLRRNREYLNQIDMASRECSSHGARP